MLHIQLVLGTTESMRRGKGLPKNLSLPEVRSETGEALLHGQKEPAPVLSLPQMSLALEWIRLP